MNGVIKIVFSLSFVMLSCNHSRVKDSKQVEEGIIGLENQIIQKQSVFENLIREFGKEAVLQAIYSIEGNTLSSFIKNREFTTIELGNYVQENRDSIGFIISKYSQYLNGLNQTLLSEKSKKINDWCVFYTLFRSLKELESGSPIFFEEIIFELPETKHLFDKYIKKNIGQDWSSLDVNQNILLIYDFFKYLTDQSINVQIEIVSKFVNEIKLKAK